MANSSLPYHVVVEEPIGEDLRSLSVHNRRRDTHILGLLHVNLLKTDPVGLLREAMDATVSELGPMASRGLVISATQSYRLRLATVRRSNPAATSITSIRRRTTVEEVKLVLMMLSRDLGLDFDEWDQLADMARR